MKSSMREVLDRHKAFWNMEDVDQPLLTTVLSAEEASMKIVLRDGTMATEGLVLKPQMISPEKIPPSLLTTWGRLVPVKYEIERGENKSFPCLIGDIFNPISPYPKIPWMEAIAGCSIYVSVKANTMWTKSVTKDDFAKIEVNEEWIEKLKTFTRYLVDKFFGRYLVSATLMRGPIDILSAVLGKKDLVLSIYRRRDETQKMISALADLFITMARDQLDIIPSFHGGYCTLTGLWAPGTAIRTQDDESTIFPQKICKELILPYHEEITSKFDYSIMDIHSGSELHMIDLLLDAENIKAISITIDPHPFGIEINDLLPFLSKIESRKPLQINGKLTREELEKTIKTLPPKGLAIIARLQT